MKKIAFYFLALGIGLASCTHLDDVSSENYGDGPSISVDATAATDHSFTLKLTPAEGTLYYSYVVTEGTELEELDSYKLLKEQYSGIATDVLSTKENATFTFDMIDAKTGKGLCQPNTSYIIYAVASNDKGIAGKITAATITTSDGDAPFYDAKGVAPIDGKQAVKIPFSEAIVRGNGKVTAKYFVEWGAATEAEMFVNIAEDKIKVDIDENIVTITTEGVPAAAVVLVSWEEGAFKDIKGNSCIALNSGFNSDGTDFLGVTFDVAEEPFTIHTEKEVEGEEKPVSLVSPALGSSLANWEDFQCEITLDMNVYRNPELLKGGELQVIYTHEGKSSTIDLAPNYWKTSGKKLMFTLPESPDYGDQVSVIIKKGAICDAYGNPNAELKLENAWLYSYGYKRDLVIGSYDLKYTSYYDKNIYTESILVEPDPQDENGLLISGFFGLDKKVKAVFDGDFATVTIKKESEIGTTSLQNGTRVIVTVAGNTADGSFVLSIDKNGNMSIPDIGFIYVAYDATTEEEIGNMEAAIDAVFTKQTGNHSVMRTSVSHKSYSIQKSGVKLLK